MTTRIKQVFQGFIAVCCAASALPRANAITVDELGPAPGENVAINCTGIGTVIVDAGILQLDVDGSLVNGLCIDPFHFSSGSMAGYQAVPLTSAPKGGAMSAGTVAEIERLWGTFYSAGMSPQDAAGLQIAVWELVGGTGFALVSKDDYGASAFLNTVQDPNYSGPAADLTGLTGSGQDYAVPSAGLAEALPETPSTFGLLALAVCVLVWFSENRFRPVPCLVTRPPPSRSRSRAD